MQPMVIRMAAAIVAAFVVGLLFDYFNSGLHLDTQTNLLRFATAFFVAIAGIVTIHPLFGFKMFLLRGAAIGALVAVVANGTGDLGNTIAMGAVLGLLVDLVATTVAGEGRKLLHRRNG